MVALLSQVCVLILHFLKLLVANSLICDAEVFVEALLLADEVSRTWVWVVHLSTVHELVVTACALTQTSLLNSFLVFHRSLYMETKC